MDQLHYYADTKLKNKLVFQHNNLIESKHRLTLQEKKIMLFLMSQIKKNDEGFKKITVSVVDLLNCLEIKNNSMYSEIQKITEGLVGKKFVIEDLDKSNLIQASWLASAKYENKKGLVTFQISDTLLPYLLFLKNQFTVLRISDLMKFKSIYAIRIYELLKQKEDFCSRVIDISDLKIFCGIPENKFTSVSNLRIKVLEIAKREINEKSDLYIDFEFLKKSREFVSIRFTMKKNPDYVSGPENKAKKKEIEKKYEYREIYIKEIEEKYHFTRKKIIAMIKGCTDAEISQALMAVQLKISKEDVQNVQGLVVSALKEKWKPNVLSVVKFKKMS